MASPAVTPMAGPLATPTVEAPNPFEELSKLNSVFLSHMADAATATNHWNALRAKDNKKRKGEQDKLRKKVEKAANKGKGKRAKTDPSGAPKPKRAPTAYNTFMKEELPRVKESNPGISHQQAFTLAAQNWKNSDKNPKAGEDSGAAAPAASPKKALPAPTKDSDSSSDSSD